jgi:hypothetical protein
LRSAFARSGLSAKAGQRPQTKPTTAEIAAC